MTIWSRVISSNGGIGKCNDKLKTGLSLLLQIQATKNDQVRSLLDYLQRRPDKDIEKFFECLKADGQGHVVTAITGEGKYHCLFIR